MIDVLMIDECSMFNENGPPFKKSNKKTILEFFEHRASIHRSLPFDLLNISNQPEMPKKTNKKKKSVSFQQDKIAKSSKKKKKSVSTRPRKQIKKTKSKKGKGRLSILDYERSDICHNIFDERLSCFWGGGVSSNPTNQDERENQEMVHNILGIQKEHIETLSSEGSVLSDLDENEEEDIFT